MHRRAGIIKDILSVKCIYLCDDSFGGRKQEIAERRARRNLKYELRQLRTGHLPGELQVPAKQVAQSAPYIHSRRFLSRWIVSDSIIYESRHKLYLVHFILEPGKLTRGTS